MLAGRDGAGETPFVGSVPGCYSTVCSSCRSKGRQVGPHDSDHSRRRTLRALAGWALVFGTALTVGVSSMASAEEHEPTVEQLQLGAALYANSCAACHGPTGQGGTGTAGEVTAGPPVFGVEVALVDQQIRTGRMPIVARELGVGGPEEFDDTQREATVAWMRERFELTGELPREVAGDIGRGHELYAQNCASCHGSFGEGGVSGDGTQVLALDNTDWIATFAATRTGPAGMPQFAEETLDDAEVADIATFVDAEITDAEVTPVGLGELGRPESWLLSALLLAVAVGMIVLIAHGPKVPLRRSAPEEPHER